MSRVWGAVFVLLLATSGCSSSTDGSDGDGGSATGKYDQSWSKSYDTTTCSEWLEEMSSQQRFAAAADMLTGARNKGDGGSGLPADDLIRQFESGLDNACVIPTATLAETAAALYLTDRERFRP